MWRSRWAYSKPAEVDASRGSASPVAAHAEARVDPRLQALLQILEAVADTLEPGVRAALDGFKPQRPASEPSSVPGAESPAADVSMEAGDEADGRAAEHPNAPPSAALAFADSAPSAGAACAVALAFKEIYEAFARGGFGGTEADCHMLLSAKRIRAGHISNS